MNPIIQWILGITGTLIAALAMWMVNRSVSRAVNLGRVNTKAMPVGYNARVRATERARKLWREL